MIILAIYKVGSRGDDVKKLQQQLGITTDGIYGKQTEAAVRDYQKKNNLAVDGIAGNQTLGSLNNSGPLVRTAQSSPSPAEQKIASETYQWGKLDPAYKNAIKTGTEADYFKNLNNTIGSMPAVTGDPKPYATPRFNNLDSLTPVFSSTYKEPETYVDPYADRINKLLDKYLGMSSFEFDENSPELLAAQDSAMSAVNREAARRGMIYSEGNKSQLGKSSMALVPQFRQAAFNEYQAGLGNIINQLQELQGLSSNSRSQFESDRNYGRGIYESDRSFGRNVLESDRNFDRGVLESDRNFNRDVLESDRNFNRGVLESDRAFDYQASRDQVLDDRWLKQFNADERQRIVQNALDKRQISISEANSALNKAEFDYRKEQDAKKQEEITLSDKVSAISADLGRMTPQDAYEELSNYAADYIADLGTPEYNRLLGIFKQLAE